MEHNPVAGRRAGLLGALQSPGLWLLIGGLQALFLIHLSEFLYPGYSVSDDYISDLGIGPTLPSAVFTAAVILFGSMGLVAAVQMRTKDKKSPMWFFLALTGIGAIGVGVFNEDYPLAHRPAALLAFLFGNIAALYSFRVARPPLSYLFALLGLVGLSALALYGAGVYLGLGVGGMERMILYPAVFWAIVFGTFSWTEKDDFGRASDRPSKP